MNKKVCETKIKAIQMISEQLQRRHKSDGSDNYALSESITIMCEEVLKELANE